MRCHISHRGNPPKVGSTCRDDAWEAAVVGPRLPKHGVRHRGPFVDGDGGELDAVCHPRCSAWWPGHTLTYKSQGGGTLPLAIHPPQTRPPPWGVNPPTHPPTIWVGAIHSFYTSPQGGEL